jgi:sec-independent protein translocase protein TatC
MGDERMPLTSHLEELRRKLIISGISWLVAFLACYAFAEPLFDMIATPVRAALPQGASLVFITATEPFFTYLKIGALAGLLVSMPVIFWQIWSFIAPGLYHHEKRYIIPFVLASTLCFATGAFFGYRYVFPMAFKVLIEFGTGSGDLSAMLSMGSYLSLSSKLLLAFGLVFELPVVIFFLARMGIVDHKMLARNRKFALLAAFLTGAMLTPPDVFSQTALALPFIVLYEIGIIVARLFGKRQEVAVDDPADAAPAE